MKALPLADIKALEAAPAFPPDLKADWIKLLQTATPIHHTYHEYNDDKTILLACCAIGGLEHLLHLRKTRNRYDCFSTRQRVHHQFPAFNKKLEEVERLHDSRFLDAKEQGRTLAIAYIEANF